ncbi:MAG: DUF4012 domain-containing protein [Patescibacteria group bacterium]
MPKQIIASKTVKKTHTLKPIKLSPGIPSSNVLDLRSTKLGSKEHAVYTKEKNKAIKKEKQIKNGGWFKSLFSSSAKQKSPKDILARSQKIQEQIQERQQEKKTIVKKSEKVKIVAQKHQPEPAPVIASAVSKTSWFQTSFKPLSFFIIICLMLIMPFACMALYYKLDDIKASVFSLSSKALEDMQVGSQLASDSNFTEASAQFNNALEKFTTAQNELTIYNDTFSAVIASLPGKGKEYKSAQNLLSAATHLTTAADNLTTAFNIFNKLDSEVLKNINATNPPSLTEIIVLGHANLKPASEEIDLANTALSQVDANKLPADYIDKINLIKEELPKINKSLKQVLQLSEAMLTILGHDQEKRYLVVFQNNREIRATGGFLGSFGVIDISGGKVTKIAIPGGGTYDLNGALKAKVISPEPMHLINPAWQIQDANWWPDWPTSAQKIEWFYNQSDGPTVDGVLALTPDIIESMLEITGPIDMGQEYNIIIDAQNFYDIVQTESEKKYDETRVPKKIIADLTPKLLSQLFSLEKDSTLSVLEVFYNALREKDILLYFNDPFLEEEMMNLGWSGSIKNTDSDYLSIINTNISGGKTDGVIEEIINHKSEIQSDGSIIDTVSVTRTHKGHIDNTFTSTLNWDYIRVYVPEGSELLSSSGFNQPDNKLILDTPEGYTLDTDLKNISGDTFMEENSKMRINKEFNKTVFANWQSLEPGASKTYTISYRLPFTLQTGGWLKNTDTYSLLVQKQSGSFNSLFNTELILPDNYAIKWRYPKDFQNSFNSVLDTDKYLGVVIVDQK